MHILTLKRLDNSWNMTIWVPVSRVWSKVEVKFIREIMNEARDNVKYFSHQRGIMVVEGKSRPAYLTTYRMQVLLAKHRREQGLCTAAWLHNPTLKPSTFQWAWEENISKISASGLDMTIHWWHNTRNVQSTESLYLRCLSTGLGYLLQRHELNVKMKGTRI